MMANVLESCAAASSFPHHVVLSGKRIILWVVLVYNVYSRHCFAISFPV